MSKDDQTETHVGRRAVLGVAALGAAGIALGSRVENTLGGTLTRISSDLGGLGALVPGADEFRIYTVTGSIPTISPESYRLRVDGMVERPLELSLDDLRAMRRTSLTHYFQCVTGWRVPNVHWEGVQLSEVLARGPEPNQPARRCGSSPATASTRSRSPSARRISPTSSSPTR